MATEMKMKLMALLGATLDACPAPRISVMHPSASFGIVTAIAKA